MKRLVILLLAVGVLTGAAFLSTARSDRTTSPPSLDAKFDVVVDDKKNPWTSLNANAAPELFQFVVVSDRTGGHRSGVFSRAVQQVNLLQPEFVMSVGDLIEGTATAEGNRKQWEEFDGYAKQFKMPFFYTPGNHDAQSLVKADVWTERLGRRYYHFKYKNTLFIVMNSQDFEGIDAKEQPKAKEEPKGKEQPKQPAPGLRIGQKQREYVAKALQDNKDARWTFVFIHHPIWAGKTADKTGWLDVEKLLADRSYTVFCGHVHRYQKFIRNGMNYYQLATTGGGSALRGVEYGEFDQVGWVTMTKDGPVLANIMLDGVLKDDLQPYPSEEAGGVVARELLPSVSGTVTMLGKPGAGLLVRFTEIVAGDVVPTVATAKTTREGTFALYDSKRGPGIKAGKYKVTFDIASPLVLDPKAELPMSTVPEKYRALETSPLQVEVKEGSPNRFTLKIED